MAADQSELVQDPRSFILGTTCWHVVNESSPMFARKTLCGWGGNDYVIGGDATDIACSLMPCCQRCTAALSGRTGDTDGE